MARLLAAAVSLALVLTGAAVLPAAAHAPVMSPATASAATASEPTVATQPTAPLPTGLEGVTSWSVDPESAPGVTTSPEIHTETFTLAAVSWDRTGPQPDHLELRVRQGARWGEWFDLVIDETEAPDRRFASEPFIADGASRLQARIAAPAAPAGLRIDLVHVADDGASSVRASAARSVSSPASSIGTATAALFPASTALSAGAALPAGTALPAAAARPASAAASATGDELQPRIVSRRAWGANERGTTQVSSSTWLKAMYVHHTAGPNSYSKARSRAVVRGIWAFHTNGRGWPDIGYQFLVDRYGTIYEDRRGSIAGLPVGAQAGGYNASTIGVAVMGNHTSVAPSQTVVDAVVDVLAWQAHRWGVDPSGKVKLRTARSTGSKTRWAYGRQTAALPVIRGHRDTNHTACPGVRLYAKLPAIRRAVEAKVKRAERTHGATPAQLRAPRAEPLRARADGVSLAATVHLAWRKVPGAQRYEVVRRSAKHGKDPGQTKYAWMVESRTKKAKAKVRVPRGQTWTVGVRAVDALGRPGKVRPIGTTTRPLAAKHVKRAGEWRTAKGAEHFGGAAHFARERGATLTVRGAKGVRAVWLVAATGPQQGRVAVFVGGKRVAKVPLTRSTGAPRELIEVPLPKARSGTVRIRTLNKKPVRISAVILERGRQ